MIYLHLLSFLCNEMAQAFELFPCGRHRLVHVQYHVVDDLATQGDRWSTTMILAQFFKSASKYMWIATHTKNTRKIALGSCGDFDTRPSDMTLNLVGYSWSYLSFHFDYSSLYVLLFEDGSNLKFEIKISSIDNTLLPFTTIDLV